MRRQHVFVVNGSPHILNLLRKLLQDERYNVTATNFVPQTCDQIAALHPSLLSIDLAVGVRAGRRPDERHPGHRHLVQSAAAAPGPGSAPASGLPAPRGQAVRPGG